MLASGVIVNEQLEILLHHEMRDIYNWQGVENLMSYDPLQTLTDDGKQLALLANDFAFDYGC